MERYLAIWFRHLTTDFLARQLANTTHPFVIANTVRNRKIVTAANSVAARHGIEKGMAVADARTLVPALQVFAESEGLEEKLLTRIAQWCLRYTPFVALNLPDGLMLDISGCTYLWGGERPYFREVIGKITEKHFTVRGAIADTAGAAWAWSRYGANAPIIAPGEHPRMLGPLPVNGLRLEDSTLLKLRKLGLTTISHVTERQRSFLLPRFDHLLVDHLDEALGRKKWALQPVQESIPYQERLACLDPIVTATGIEIALTRLLEQMGRRLQQEGKGLRTAVLTCYRIDGVPQRVEISTTRPSYNVNHLFRLFELKTATIATGTGIEVFTLDAPLIEDASALQESLWGPVEGVDTIGFAELLDRLSNKAGIETITRFLPSEHHWPERKYRKAGSLKDKPASPWSEDPFLPFHLFADPVRIEVMAPVPDYPPKAFRYRNKHHKVVRADGPKRNEAEWWIEGRLVRDYYAVEDEEGNRYCLFRSGHYGEEGCEWYIHGIFA